MVGRSVTLSFYGGLFMLYSSCPNALLKDSLFHDCPCPPAWVAMYPALIFFKTAKHSKISTPTPLLLRPFLSVFFFFFLISFIFRDSYSISFVFCQISAKLSFLPSCHSGVPSCHPHCIRSKLLSHSVIFH